MKLLIVFGIKSVTPDLDFKRDCVYIISYCVWNIKFILIDCSVWFIKLISENDK